MSNINITLLKSIQKFEIDLAEIKQTLHKLQSQFSNQFAPAVSAEDQATMQQSIIEQTLEHIPESVKRAQLTEYPDQLDSSQAGLKGALQRRSARAVFAPISPS
ncbi:hypothetical protein PHYBLDRAFT_142409 [Phycomyces blakesleeanus NRRL 1555(-)]|uniref:Uncharacterized protein n=1 Tax=Phycomyces blakesleeanus (strain ATCC 8743b / DSM 1359 / FGSC 10004 / NBRC 33097 / NRRL 1555) TaxID=763407 RepID=A0A162XWL0_PHYB8|nr:hypothetical protein PHYBLDRAFT_142409 [Phycomyces blakesleeanus NRRL 1555(-)]OAD76905.1 hypothetical protein PHYBLDRAFT_142409 [Phycomyces blakesleeanus NRRL 1555(-)]|eukprot:XP_018294945.1 hypothetical protein PHYBLDRAFT_142409 [Phycomyces blakesleeanus NRRL 1555(-)]